MTKLPYERATANPDGTGHETGIGTRSLTYVTDIGFGDGHGRELWYGPWGRRFFLIGSDGTHETVPASVVAGWLATGRLSCEDDKTRERLIDWLAEAGEKAGGKEEDDAD